MEERLEEVMQALQKAVEEMVPVRRELLGMKRWWMKELMEMWMRSRALGRESWKVIDIEGHSAHEAFRQARNEYSQAIKDTKRWHWEEWLATVDVRSI